jgi:hypothetical protein
MKPPSNAATQDQAFAFRQNVQLRMGIIVFQLIAGIIYVGGQFALTPPNRMAALTNSTSLDFFPNAAGFGINGGATLVWLITWQVYAWKVYKQTHPTGILFDVKIPKHAFVLPAGMLITMISGQLLPYASVDKVSPWIGLPISLAGTALLLYSALSTIPELYKHNEEELSLPVRLMVRSLPSWVGIWETFITAFWVLLVANIYTPLNKTDVDNINSPSPSPTEFHQKQSSQAVGIALMILASLMVILFESLGRVYFGGLAAVFFLMFVAIDNNESFYFAISCLVILVIFMIILIIATEVAMVPLLKAEAIERKNNSKLIKH